jgi:hypothetical protein
MAFAGGGAAAFVAVGTAAVCPPFGALAACSGLRQTCRSGVITFMIVFFAA